MPPTSVSPFKRALTYREVAEALGVSERAVYEWVRQGLITPVRFGRSVRFHRDELERVAREGVNPLAGTDPMAEAMGPHEIDPRG